VLTAKGSDSGDEKRPKKGGQKGKGKDIKRVDDVGKIFGMDRETRRKFGRFIESLKGPESPDFTFQELIQNALEFLGRR
jgi:hypothetical protein